MSSRNQPAFEEMPGSASPSSYESGSTHSTIEDLDGVSSTTGRFSRSRSGNNSRYKTELCRTFVEQGRCKYGHKCQFAHGVGELREVARHPRYKTELCKRFHANGFCSYGTRCHFVHDLQATSAVSSSTDAVTSTRSEKVAAASQDATGGSPPQAAFNSWPPAVHQPPPGLGRVNGISQENIQNCLDAVYLASLGQLIQQRENVGVGKTPYQCDVDTQIQLLLALKTLMGTQGPIPGMNLNY